METSTSARQLVAAGRFIEALRLLDDRSTISRTRADDVLWVEVLERVGRHLQCRALAERLLNTRELNHTDRSICEFSRGLVELNAGNIETAITHLQTSVSAALLAQDLERLCWPQLRLLITLSDYSVPEASRPLIGVLRTNATKLGNPSVTAALPIFVGEMEAKRGLLKSAERHTSLGLQILSSAQNLWLESIAHNTRAAVAIMMSEVERGFSRGRRALHLAQESGAVAMQRACLGNLGNLFYAIGDFDKAVEHLEMANTVFQSRGDNYNAGVDGIARIRLSQGNLKECGQILDQIDESLRTPRDHGLYGHRYSKLTRTQLLARKGRLVDALETVEGVIQLAGDSGDHLLNQKAPLKKGELLQQVGNVAEAMKTLDPLADTLAQQPPELFAHYDRILACTLATSGDMETATLHFDRAKRTYESIRSTPGLVELSRRWRETTTTHQDTAAPKPDAAPTAAARNVLQSVATLLRHHGRPELVARELVYLIDETASTLSARAVSVGEGPTEVLASAHTSAKTNDGESIEQRLAIGFDRNRRVEPELHSTPAPPSR